MLAVIAQFDEFFYDHVTGNIIKERLITHKDVIKKCFRIETTTSWQCDENDKLKDYVDDPKDLATDKKDHSEGENSIKVKIWRFSESFWRGVLFLVYKCLRVGYASMWFYFAPFITIILSYAVPLYFSYIATADEITG